MLEPGKYYHIFNRGNNKENIFNEDKNYQYFIDLYFDYLDDIVDTFAYCLMKNHFHLLIKVKETQEICSKSSGYISKQFSNFFNAYARAFNIAYNRTGALFQRPFGRIEVDTEDYYTQLIYYIHFNPQKHAFTNDFRVYPHSSYQIILSSEPTRIRREEVIRWFNGRENYIEFHNRTITQNLIKNLIDKDEF